MRILPSQSSVMKRNVGSTTSLTTRQIDPVALRDARPVVHAGAAQRIDAHADAASRGSTSMSITFAEIVHIGGQVVVAVRGRGTPAPARSGMRAHAGQARLEQPLAPASIHAGDLGVGGAAVRRVVLEAAAVAAGCATA